MRIVVDETQDPETWDARVMSLDGTVFHSHAWAQFRCHDGRGRPLFFRWFQAGASEPVAAALAIQRPAPGQASGLLGSRLTFDSAPASLARDVELAASVREWARRSRSIVEVGLGSFDARTPWSTGRLPNSVERLEFHLPPRNEADALRQMRKGARWSIKQAGKAGVTVRAADQRSQLLTFAHLYAATLRRLEKTKGLAHRSLDPSRFAESLALLVAQDRGRLYAATLNGETVAGCFFGLFGNSAFYLYNGSDNKALRVGATPLLLLSASREFSSCGFRRINLGGVGADAMDPRSKEHGLYEFKLGLGADAVRCTGAVLHVRPARARLVRMAGRLKSGYGSLHARHS